MSQSPAETLKLQRYENGWEAINRMIREDLSWGGRERNCLHVGGSDGTFANISAASGVDYRDDGRALGILDIDRDGRPDLLLRNRTAPLVRVLQNTWPNPGESLWLKLEGGGANRDAIGARIHVHTRRGVRVKEVQAGNLFLSQSSRWIPIGVDSVDQARVTVRWPGGKQQDLGLLETGKRYVVREGEPARGQDYQPTADYGTSGGASSASVADGEPTADDGAPPADEDSPAVATWLIDPGPAPSFALTPVGAAGATSPSPLGPGSFRGRPLFLHFISTTCGVCLSETPAMRHAERAVEKAGAAFLHVIANRESGPEAARKFVVRAGFRAPAVRADDRTLSAYNVLHRHIWNLRRDLAVPTTFLVDAAGLVTKVYRGHTRPEDLALDLERLPASTGERLRLATPYPGTHYTKRYRRDLVALGNAYLEAGLGDLAQKTFQRSVRRDTGNPDSLFNFAVASERAGQLEEARNAYRKVLDMAPASDDARNNLGVLLARSGEKREAERMFRSILERNPAHGEAPLNLGNLLLDERRLEEALRVFQGAVTADPESALFHRHLGYAQFKSSRLDEALESLEESMRLDPLDTDAHLELAIVLFSMSRPDDARDAAEAGLKLAPGHPPLLNALGMAQLALGETDAGIASLENAIRSDPRFDRAYLNLARFHERQGRADAAREVIERLLKAVPGHPVGGQR